MNLSEYRRIITSLPTVAAKKAFYESAKHDVTDDDGDPVEVKIDFHDAPDEGATTTIDEKRIEEIVAKAFASIPRPKISPIRPWSASAPGERSKVFKGEDGAEKAARIGTWFKSQFGMRGKAQHEGSNTAGGHLVPPEFSGDIINLANDFGAIARFARNHKMTRETLSIPRVTGRPSAYFTSELSAATESNMAFDLVNLTARKLTCLNIQSSEILEDSIVSLGDLLAKEFARSIAYTVDDCGFNGDGSATYGSIEGVRSKLVTINGVDDGGGLVLASGNEWSEITLPDLTRLTSRLPTYARQGAAWYCSPAFADQVLLKLVMSAGGATGADLAYGVQARQSFLGYPINLVEVMPAAQGNSQVCLLFGDLSQAVAFGDRRELRVDVFNAGTVGSVNLIAADAMAIRATMRFDINCHDLGTSTAAGPIVGLITASS